MEALSSKVMGLAAMLVPLFILILIVIGLIIAARWINANLAIQQDKNQFQSDQKVLIKELIDTLKKGNK